MAKARLETGATLDGFLIGELIHTGGMATLWSVTRDDIAFPMLMKVPKLTEGEDPATIVSFEMEQMILPRLAGPHVPKFVAAADFAAQPYLVMERLPGASLLPLLKQLPLPPEEVTAIGARIADALDDLHRQHVVHLDVKPSNIMHRATGEAVLIDFGLSRHDQLPDLMEEEFRLPYGTAPYMAPEQVLGMRRDPRSDLFALGVLMYFFVTGERPFGDPPRLKGLKKRLWRDPEPPRKLRPDCPPWLQEVILRCLEVNPAWRHPTAAQLASDLRNPGQVTLTARAERLRRDSWATVIRRRFNQDTIGPVRRDAVATQIAAAPIIAVAIDLTEGSAALAELLRTTVARVLETVPGARLACINVLKESRIKLESTFDEEGHNKHIQRLVELKHWAEPLGIDKDRLTYHVFGSTDPAGAILDYVRANRVDHIIMGARANTTMRRLLGSVSGEVAANAPCTVTVARSRQHDGADSETTAA
ncbi:MAG: protein kinase [Alphaproteobacteria bacterium]|nr:protein kinase [Alphaproteobacteria bacterium]